MTYSTAVKCKQSTVYFALFDSLFLFFFFYQLLGSLEEVHMPQNGINHPGISALAAAIKHNPNLQVLNLNDNTFTKRGSVAMAEVC